MNGSMLTRMLRANVALFKGIVVLALLATLLPACTVLEGQATATEMDTFVGAVNDDLFVGIAVAEASAGEDTPALIAYLCDGEAVSQWFIEERVESEMTLTAGDTVIELTLDDGRISGTVALAGQGPQPFEAALAQGDAGLYRAEESFDGVNHVGGWIVLEDGRQQGAVSADGTVVENPTLNLETREATTSAGTLNASPMWGGGGGSGKPSF